MNIFYLDDDTKICAQYHCDKHVVKMILESAQMLCTTHRLLSPQAFCEDNKLYKESFNNHPCTIWTRLTAGNYLWLYSLFCELIDEYKFRFSGRTHSCESLKEALATVPESLSGTEDQRSPHAVAMPIECQVRDTETGDINPLESYKFYYAKVKYPICEYTRREFPQWLHDKRHDIRGFLSIDDQAFVELLRRINVA